MAAEVKLGLSLTEVSRMQDIDRSLPVTRMEGDVSVLPLDLQAEESVFVVFREPTADRGRTVSNPPIRQWRS